VFDHAPSVAVVLLLWLIGGVHAALGANVVSELFTAVPRSGGLFVMVLRAFAPLAD
jgi:amino acid transporter